MNYIENIYVCLAVPILAACFFLQGKNRKTMIFLLAGVTSCLLSSYISTFIAGLVGADKTQASVEIVPIIEEVIKFLPLLFYVVVFSPRLKD